MRPAQASMALLRSRLRVHTFLYSRHPRSVTRLWCRQAEDGRQGVGAALQPEPWLPQVAVSARDLSAPGRAPACSVQWVGPGTLAGSQWLHAPVWATVVATARSPMVCLCVLSQGLAGRGLVPGCGGASRARVFAPFRLEPVGVVAATNARLYPFWLLASQHVHTASKGSQDLRPLSAQWLFQKARWPISSAPDPRTGMPRLWLNLLALQG